MKRLIALALFGLVLAVASAAHAQAVATGEPRLALVIGNSKYAQTPLKNAANDARMMSRTLRRLGFEVIERVDSGKKAMEDAILEFGEKLKAGGIGMFFYAGHGVQVRGHNYLVPIDASLPSEASVRVQGVDVELVLEQMSEARNRANVVILDACRNNPFLQARRGAGKGLAAIDAARGTLIAYSTAPGTVAVDGDGDNSPYTASLVRAIEQPGLPVEDIFKRVRAAVLEQTQGGQTPWESSSLTGDLVLNLNITINVPPTAAPTAAPAAAAPARTEAAQVAFWETMGRSSNVADYEDYLRQFPQGIYAGLAKRRIAELKKPPQTAAVAPPAPPPAPAPKPAPATVPATTPQPPQAPAQAQQAAIAAPPPVPSPATGTSTRFDGRWSGTDQQWRVELAIGGGQVSGTASCPSRGRVLPLTGTIDDTGRIAFDLKGLRLEPRQLVGNLPNLTMSPGGQCGGASLTMRQDSGPAVQAAAPAPPTPSQPPSPYGQPAPQTAAAPASSAISAAEVRQRSYERVMTILLGQTVQSGRGQGRRNDYRDAPRPKALAACVDWSASRPEELRVGAWGSSSVIPGTIGRPVRPDAMAQCDRVNDTPQACTCQLIDENDTNVLDVPPDFANRAARR